MKDFSRTRYADMLNMLQRLLLIKVNINISSSAAAAADRQLFAVRLQFPQLWSTFLLYTDAETQRHYVPYVT